MQEYDLKKLIEENTFLDEKISAYKKSGVLVKQSFDDEEIKGHILKSDHNLAFVAKISTFDFLDWVLVGCYYAAYHSALALILSKGFSSKNHLATLCILIKECYNKDLSMQDLEFISNSLDYQDVLFYVESKNKRELASYSTHLLFDKKQVRALRLKTILFINKVKDILKY